VRAAAAPSPRLAPVKRMVGTWFLPVLETFWYSVP
jgi:hypothetical protein